MANQPALVHAEVSRSNQAFTLARSILAYAENIDNLELIHTAVERIAHKHASLDIRPEQYPIVGECIIAAIQDVLKEAATPEIVNAWKEAFGYLAEIFINRENQLRKESAEQPGGWEGFRKFVVAKKVKESDVAYSFYLKPQDNGPLPSFHPGQYITIKPENLPSVGVQYRNYSLSDSPNKDYFRVTIKREPAIHPKLPPGVCSNFMHDQVNEGDVLDIGPPYGEFHLNEESKLPLVLLSAGIGITPMLSMLHATLEHNSSRPIHFAHFAKNKQLHHMKSHLKELAEKYPQLKVKSVYSDPTPDDKQGVDYDVVKNASVDLPLLRKLVPTEEAEFYFCGPVQFMLTVKNCLISSNVKPERIHFECFGPHSPELGEAN